MNDIEVLKKLLADAERIKTEISNLNREFHEWYLRLENHNPKVTPEYKGVDLHWLMYNLDGARNRFIRVIGYFKDMVK